MNFKFNVKGFELKMKGEGHVNIEGIEVEYTDVKLSEIPAIIKEVRKAMVDFSEIAQAPTYSREEYPYAEDDKVSDPILDGASDDTDEILFSDEPKPKKNGKKNGRKRDANDFKQDLFDSLSKIKTDSDMPRDFECLGNITDVYPDLPEKVLEAYRVWIWESKERDIRVATSDHGNTHLSFLCEGTQEELIKHLS